MAEILKEFSEIVSSESESLILVDEQDNEIGNDTKGRCHDGNGILHRAFSLFIFNDQGALLIQKRSEQKRLWPLYWSNTCCSHPRQGEEMKDSIHRRLYQELQLKSELHFLYKFQYHAKFKEEGSEHELCSVYIGKSSQAARVNRNEIAEIKYISPERLTIELREHPEQFTPWFKMEWQRLTEDFALELKKL